MYVEEVSGNRLYPENQLPYAPGGSLVAYLARAGKSFTEINKTEAAYGVRSLSMSKIYRIIKQAKARKETEDQRHLNPPKNSSCGKSHCLRGRCHSRCHSR